MRQKFHSFSQTCNIVQLKKGNCSTVSEFILLGLSELLWLSIFLSLVFLLIYGVTVMGNLGMITVIQVSSQLHTSMHFFLSHLSFVDFCYSTIIVPKMLANILNKDNTIFFPVCMIQLYLFCTYTITKVILLAVMAYDCFVAICNPRLYLVIMSWKLCMGLVPSCYLCGAVCSLIHICLALQIPSHRSNVVKHFCDLPPLLFLAFSDVFINELLWFIVATSNEIITIMIILPSYLFILITILRMHSAEGRCKAFSACTSHLTAIVVFHGTILFIYCRPSSDFSLETDKVVTVFYTVVISMLNPLIYTLRSKDVKAAVMKIMGFKLLSAGLIS
ncbi:olfactory receptor 5L1-like [Choloepus didactylus]|uniref:olfactory receptor 5L1-like n=1 Tax=Choloepus didactylus TaxID=27675 RepID=UPI00189D051F|nr:olfactory receptor 5L1-like [Choloepus didactylus]